MILSSVRIAKSQKAYSSLIHNILSTKNKINDLQNIMYEVNNRGQIRQEKFTRDYNNSNMYKQQTEKIKNDIEKIKKDYQEHSYKGLKLRKDAHLFKEGIITFGDTKNKDYDKKIRELSQKEDFNRDVINGIRDVLKEFGIEGNISVFQHNDETSVHYHFDYLSYNFNTHKVINKEYSPRMLSKIQDTFSKSIEKYDIHRGIKKVDRIRDYITKNNIDYEKMTRKEQIEVIEKANIQNKSLKKYDNDLQKNSKKIINEIEEQNNIKKQLLKEIIDIRKQKQEEQKELTNVRGEITKSSLTVEERKKEYGKLDIINKQKRKEITEMKELEKQFKNIKLNPQNIEDIIKKNSSIFSTDYSKISKILNVITKEEITKNNSEIIEKNKKNEEEKDYYIRENDIKRGVIKGLEVEKNDLKTENNNLKKENQKLKDTEKNNIHKIDFYNKFTPEQIKEIEEYRKSQKNEGYKKSLKM